MSTLPPSQSLMGPTTPITPPVMVFTPTWDEFQNFERYVEFIESQGAARAGLAKIIPPSEWMPCSNQYEEMDLTVPMPVDQKVTGSKGHFQQIRTWKKPIHISDLEKLANSPEYVTPGCSSYDELESLYWQDMSNSHTIYPSADVDASLCDESLPVWNLRNLRTILDELTIDYPDQELTKPTLDFGLWKTTFPWRVEMMNLYSCNYLHFGAPKTWYAVPPDQVTQMEDLAAGFFPSEGPKCPAFLRHKTVIISPRVFRNHNISVLKITQEPGEIIISFPSTYTAGFSHGFNCAESVNFATQRWIDHGKLFKQCICSEDLPQFSMNIFVKRYQPNLYEKWKIQHEIKQREALEQWRSAHEVNNVDENENEVLHVMKHVDTDSNNNELPDGEDDYEAGAQTSNKTNNHMNNTPTGTPFNHQQKTYRTKEIVSGRPASGRGSGVKGKEPPIYAENVTHTRLDDSSNSRLNPVIMKQAQKAVQAAAAELKANTRDTRSGRLSAGRLDLSKLEVRASKRGKDKRGSLDSIVHIDDGEVSFKKRKSASQPYEIVDGEYVCTPCNKPFRSKDELDHHIRNHKLNCMLCDMSFQFKCHLKAHLRSHEEKAFVCPKCPKSFMYQQNLDIHVRIHTPGPLPFGCTQCDKTFLRKQELVVHQMKHTGERPFKCEVCPAAFRELSKLKIHNLIHTQEKPHVCSVCSKAFQRSEALKQHFTTHTGAKLYKCNTCGREFGHYSGFKIHRRVHTGEKAYKCDVCQTTFRHLATLKTHQMIHTGAAPYPCDVCGKGFRSSSERKQHLRSKLVHLKKNWKCVACGKRFKQEKILRNHVVLHRRELRDVALKHIYYTPESGDEENESGGARQQLVLSTPNGGQSVDSTSSQVIVKQEQTTPTTTPADSTVTPSSSKEVSPAATPSKRGRKGRKTSTPVKRHARKSDEILEPSSRAKLRVDSNNNRVTM